MSGEGMVPEQIASITDDRLRPLMVGDSERKQEAKERVGSHLQAAPVLEGTAKSIYDQIGIFPQGMVDSKQLLLDELSAVDENVAKRLKKRNELGTLLANELGAHEALQLSTDAVSDLESYSKNCPESLLQKIMMIQAEFRRSGRVNRNDVLGFIDQLNSVDGQWRDVIHEFGLPQDLIENIEGVALSIWVRNALGVVESNKHQLSDKDLVGLRARLFEHLIDRGYDAEIVLDLVEGRYDIEDPNWSGNMVEGFLPIRDYVVQESKRGRMSIKTRIILINITTLLASAYVLRSSENQYAPLPPTPPSTLSEPLVGAPPVDMGGADEGGGGVNERESAEGTASGKDTDEPRIMDWGDSTPDAENEGGGEGIGDSFLWEIQGEIPDENYQQAVGLDFNSGRWSRDVSYGNSERVFIPPLSTESESSLISTFVIQKRGELFNIPVPVGWRLVSLRFGDSEDQRFTVYQTAEGNYFAELTHDSPEPKQVIIGLAVDENPSGILPSENLTRTDTLIGDASQLDSQLREELDVIKNDPLLLDAEKAQRVTSLVKDHFIYSLKEKYSDFYLADRSDGEYVRRAWSVGFGDCDMVNTVNVAFLRYVGLPARLAYGYSNDTDLLNRDRKTLDKSESHGWGQFYNSETGLWEEADATPSIVDEEAKKSLNELNGGAGILNVFDSKALENVFRTMRFGIAQLEEFGQSPLGVGVEALISPAVYASLYAAASRRQRRNNEKIHQIRQKIGDSFSWRSPGDRAISHSVDQILTSLINRRSRYPHDYDAPWRDRFLIVPRLRKAARDRDQVIKPLENTLNQQSEHMQIQPGESVPEYIARLTGMGKDDVVAEIQRERYEAFIRSIDSSLETSLQLAFDEQFRTGLKFKLGVWSRKLRINQIYAEFPDNKVLFVARVMDALYDQYTGALKAIHRRSRRSRKTRGDAVGGTHFGPKAYASRPRCIFVTKEPVGKEAFVDMFGPEIALLLTYHKVLSWGELGSHDEG